MAVAKKNDPNVNLRKQAHRAALARLAKEFRFEYQIFLEKARVDRPNLVVPEIVRVARGYLREAFPNRFSELYDEEKSNRGIESNYRDYEEIAQKAIAMYAGGSGPSMRAISRTLAVDYTFVRRVIKEAGIVPPTGRRRKTNG